MAPTAAGLMNDSHECNDMKMLGGKGGRWRPVRARRSLRNDVEVASGPPDTSSKHTPCHRGPAGGAQCTL